MKSDFDVALERAHIGEGPQPECLNRPEEFALYDHPLPTKEHAEELCAPCPLFSLCAAHARRRRPQWGIYAGSVWVKGRRAHTLESDDPRLVA